MSPTARRIVPLPALTLMLFVAATLLSTLVVNAQTQKVSGEKNADKPLYVEYKGVRIGMEADEVRKKLGSPTDKGDVQDFFVFSEKESAQVFYDKTHKVMAVSVNYVGEQSGAPQPVTVLGTEIEAKADGALHKMVRYPEAGYWVSYNRTGGDDPLITVTMQKIQ
jgi:outer membrane protein assembly factor BamE (lipoprotein component of BamABCDE complex)